MARVVQYCTHNPYVYIYRVAFFALMFVRLTVEVTVLVVWHKSGTLSNAKAQQSEGDSGTDVSYLNEGMPKMYTVDIYIFHTKTSAIW